MQRAATTGLAFGGFSISCRDEYEQGSEQGPSEQPEAGGGEGDLSAGGCEKEWEADVDRGCMWRWEGRGQGEASHVLLGWRPITGRSDPTPALSCTTQLLFPTYMSRTERKISLARRRDASRACALPILPTDQLLAFARRKQGASACPSVPMLRRRKHAPSANAGRPAFACC